MSDTFKVGRIDKFGLGDLLKIVALLGSVGSVVSIWFVYKYLGAVGRADLFMEVIGDLPVVSYVLAIGVLFGGLAVISLATPSFVLIIIYDEIKKYIPGSRSKRKSLSMRLVLLAMGLVVFMLMFFVSMDFGYFLDVPSWMVESPRVS